MSTVIKGILSFPKLFKAESNSPAMAPRFGVVVLLEPNDPQVAQIQQAIHTAKLNHWPNGQFPAVRECLVPYDEAFAGKDYYDSQFSGWWTLSANTAADNPPAVVGMDRQPLMDATKVFSGCVAYVNVGIAVYTTGSVGVGAFLNGVMVTDEEPPRGRLDGKPSVDQMFSGVQGHMPAPAPAPAPAAAPVAPAPAPSPAPAAPAPAPAPAPAAPAPAPAPAPAGRQMTAAATATYEAYKAAGWSDEALIQNGLMLPPAATPSFH